MSNEILLAIIQAATEFLPISSSGHLALLQNLLGEPDLFLITILHMASLLAILIFTRNEILDLLSFKKEYRKLWLFLILATIPAALFGFFFNSLIESAINSLLYIAIGFFFTGTVLLSTKFANRKEKLNYKNAIIIGLFQVLALFPGVSRSGMTISSALLFGIEKEKATKFSFLLFIPLILGATLLQTGEAYFSLTLLAAFIICAVLSIIFLYLLLHIIKKEKFWMFSIYCFAIGIVTLGLYLL